MPRKDRHGGGRGKETPGAMEIPATCIMPDGQVAVGGAHDVESVKLVGDAGRKRLTLVERVSK